MRWNSFICLLLVSAVLAKPRPRRSLGYIKNFISNKLFGSKTVVIAQPTLAKNQAYQLFKIPGYDNILIKVNRKNEPINEVKIENAVIVKPEIAIIGSYLGTKTEKETLLAIEMVKSLLKTGVLTGVRDSSAQEVIVPMMPQQYFEEQNVYPYSFTEDQGHVFVPVTQLDTHYPLPIEYPSLIVEEPVKSIYSYKQKGAQADTTYESYNNGDVLVTRTMKEPPYPQFIKSRVAEVATIGANPYMLSQYGPLEVNSAPIPVPYYVNPAIMTENVQGNHFLHDSFSPSHLQNMKKVIVCREKFGKMCPHENVHMKRDKNDKRNILEKSKPTKDSAVDINGSKSESNANRIAVNEFLKNQTVNGQLTSQYLYRQMNHHSHDNYTVVKVGEAPKLSHETVKTSGDLNKDFFYVPPIDVESSMLNVLRVPNEAITNNKVGQKQDDRNAFISKLTRNQGISYVPSLSAFSNNVNSFEKHPIVVTEQRGDENKNIKAKTNEDVESKDDIYENRRGDIPGATY